ncbi:MAG: hypothetical protein ACQERE_02060 [Pseudomonadota bacterium]
MMYNGMHTGGMLWMFLVGIILVIPFWKLSSRAGYPGPLGLLILIPILNLAFLYFLAFSRWPANDRDGW